MNMSMNKKSRMEELKAKLAKNSAIVARLPPASGKWRETCLWEIFMERFVAVTFQCFSNVDKENVSDEVNTNNIVFSSGSGEGGCCTCSSSCEEREKGRDWTGKDRWDETCLIVSPCNISLSLKDDAFVDDRLILKSASRGRRAMVFHEKGEFEQIANKQRAKAKLEKLQVEYYFKKFTMLIWTKRLIIIMNCSKRSRRQRSRLEYRQQSNWQWWHQQEHRRSRWFLLLSGGIKSSSIVMSTLIISFFRPDGLN